MSKWFEQARAHRVRLRLQSTMHRERIEPLRPDWKIGERLDRLALIVDAFTADADVLRRNEDISVKGRVKQAEALRLRAMRELAQYTDAELAPTKKRAATLRALI